MSKKKRLQMQKKKHSADSVQKVGNFYASDDVSDEFTPSIQILFDGYFSDLYGILEYLSDDLISELLASGGNWEYQQLIDFRDDGWLYSRKQDCIRRGYDF